MNLDEAKKLFEKHHPQETIALQTKSSAMQYATLVW